MQYYVTFRVDGRYIVGVEAENEHEAISEAAEKYFDADFGELGDIDADPIMVEDENGNYVFEK